MANTYTCWSSIESVRPIFGTEVWMGFLARLSAATTDLCA